MPSATLPVAAIADIEELEDREVPLGTTRPRPRKVIPAHLRNGWILFLLTIAAILIDGYHPYSEDAGIYVAGIKHLASPEVFGTSAAFITPYFRFSCFSWGSNLVMRAFHLPLDYFLLLMQLATTWLLLVAVWRLASHLFLESQARWGATALVAVCLSVPVAGSALSMMDPYLTGRSLSTPLTLLAISACLDRKPLRVTVLLVLTIMCHPLMAIYSIAFVVILWAFMRRSWIAVAGLIFLAFAAACLVNYSQRPVVESVTYQAAVATRSYYFLYRWRWYELVGIAAPLLLLAACSRFRDHRSDKGIFLTRTCLTIGLLCTVISLVFARPSSSSHVIAALQTIRPFLIIYFCMFLVLGGILGQFFLRKAPYRWASFFFLLATGMAFCQHLAYPASPHLELPWSQNLNDWHCAFLWVRANTQPAAIVALDANYINAPGEDSQGFRAVAERASLADFSKDGGAAAAFPQLADRWQLEHTATTSLNEISDSERLRRLAPFHVSWIVLDGNATTHLICPFQTAMVKVCRLQ